MPAKSPSIPRYFLAAAVFLLPSAAAAQTSKPQPVAVHVSTSAYLKANGRIARVSVANADIADVAAFPPDQILVTGKRVGSTTATVWLSEDTVQLFMIEVSHPVQEIAEALQSAIPGAADIQVRQAGQTVVLSGQVPSVADITRAEQIASGFLTGSVGATAAVVNGLTVPGDQQVQIEVAFAEVSRTALRELGVNFWSRKSNYAGGILNPSTDVDSAVPTANGLNTADGVPLLAKPLSGTFGAVFSSTIGDFPFSATISLLANRGYARVLTEPTLVAMSGEKASFLAGGEFPIPLPQTLGTIAVEYKEFGIQLNFTPTVVGDTIQLNMGMTVSDIDFSTGVRLASVNVPGLTTRHATSTIRLRDGQSFVVAGLLSDRVRSQIDKIPGLGDLPVLGALFRSSSYRREETELLVVVTAKRVRPLGDRPELPGEHTKIDPNDLELFLLGSGESKETDDAGNQTPPATPPAAAPKQPLAPAGAVGFAR